MPHPHHLFGGVASAADNKIVGIVDDLSPILRLISQDLPAPGTNRRMYRLLSSGEIGDPWGVPIRWSRLRVLVWLVPEPRSDSTTGISSHIFSRCSRGRSRRSVGPPPASVGHAELCRSIRLSPRPPLPDGRCGSTSRRVEPHPAPRVRAGKHIALASGRPRRSVRVPMPRPFVPPDPGWWGFPGSLALAVRLENILPAERLGTIRFVPQCLHQFAQPPFRSVRLDVSERLAVYPRTTFVGLAQAIGEFQHVPAMHLVVQTVETEVRRVLGFGMQRNVCNF